MRKTRLSQTNHRKKSQKSLTSFFTKQSPGLTKEEQEIDDNLAMFCYCSGSSFRTLENPYLQKVLEICRRDVVLPTRQKLAGELLQFHHDKTKHLVNKKLSQHGFYGLVPDGWSNVNKDPVLNFILVNPTENIFLKSVYTQDESHTGEYLSMESSKVIESFHSQIVGMVTDNISANKKSWKILEQKFPDKYFYGCVCHTLNLIVKDLFPPTILQMKEKYPDGYPFQDLCRFSSNCRELVLFFKNHQVLKSTLESKQRELEKPHLVVPVITRWSSIRNCFTSLEESDSIIQHIVNDRQFLETDKDKDQQVKRTKIKNFVTRKDFMTNLRMCIKILNPLNDLILFFESDTVPLSKIYEVFHTLPDTVKEMKLQKDQETFVLKLIDER